MQNVRLDPLRFKFLNGRTSVEKLIEIHSLKIASANDAWWLTLEPKEGHHYTQGFSINKKTGEVGQSMTGHN